MRQLIVVLLVSAVTLGLAVPAAYAGDTATNVALGLASFAVFNQLVGPLLYQGSAPAAPVYVYQPPPPQVIYVAPPQVVVIHPPARQIIVVPGTPVCYGPPGHCKRGGPPPWAGYWRKHWR